MRDVCKLAAKGFCVLLPMVGICIYTWVCPLAFMDEEAPYYMWNKKTANTAQEKTYDTVILGDSVANAAYVPEILSDTTINLALGGTTPVESYYVLRDWLDNNQAPEVCYISFMDHHLYEEDCFWKRIMYSHRFKTGQVAEILKKAVQHNEDSIIHENFMMDFISYGLRLPNKYITSLMNAGFNQRYEENTAGLQLTELHRGRYIVRSLWEGTVPEGIVFSEFRVAPMFDEYYRKTIQLCLENRIQVRIVKLPLPEGEEFTEEYIREFNEYYGTLKNSFPGITVDWFPSYEKKGFCDAAHMNSYGALQFSKEIRALYNDDFEDAELSPGQVNGINNYIMEENDIEQIMAWIAGNKYSLILNDASGNFENIYQERIKDVPQESLYQMDQKQFRGCQAYYISGKKDPSINYTLRFEDDGLIIDMDGQERQILDNPADGCLNMAVIDQYNGKLLCMKSFMYEKEKFTLTGA